MVSHLPERWNLALLRRQEEHRERARPPAKLELGNHLTQEAYISGTRREVNRERPGENPKKLGSSPWRQSRSERKLHYSSTRNGGGKELKEASSPRFNNRDLHLFFQRHWVGVDEASERAGKNQRLLVY